MSGLTVTGIWIMTELRQGMLKGRTKSKNRVESSLLTLTISVCGQCENICTCVSVAPKKSLVVCKSHNYISFVATCDVEGDTKNRELLKNPTKIEEIQEKNLLTEIEPLQLAF